VLTAGPDHEPPGHWRHPRAQIGPEARRLALVAVVAVTVGGVGGLLLGRAGAHASAAQPSPTPSEGIVVPEVVQAETIPGTGGMDVRPVVPLPDGSRNDYSLVGVPWLAPDGTVRAGPPGCRLPVGGVQDLMVAVVHASAVAGGPDQDRVIWFRCTGKAPPP
jgi:hypothetical protein